MKRDQPLNDSEGFAAAKDLDARLAAAFSKTSAIALAILDNQRRFRFVNKALVTIHNSVPADAFVGSTFRDILGDAATEVDVRFQRVGYLGETPAAEVAVKLPARAELGFWIEKNFAIQGKSGSVIRIVSLAVEITENRKLQEYFRQVCGERLWNNDQYQWRTRELHNAIDGYHAAVARNLEVLSHCTVEPERIPDLLTQSMEELDENIRKLTSVAARCFPIDPQH